MYFLARRLAPFHTNSAPRLASFHPHSRRLLVQNRHNSTVRQLVKEYGFLAFGVYTVLSTSTFCCCLYSITNLGISQKDVSAAFAKVRDTFGIPPADPAEAEKPSWIDWDRMPEFTRDPWFVDTSTKVLLAMGMTKLFLPIKLTIVAAVVPPLARKFRKMGWMAKK